MTNSDYTHITMVCDRSGSMGSIAVEVENGVNAFVDDQKKESGKCTFLGYQFDSQVDVWAQFGPIADTPRYNLVPRDLTALLDATMKAINETGEKLSAMPENERPGQVVFVVATDGQENKSRECTHEQLKMMIERQTNTYGWVFVYIASDPTAFAAAGSMGFAANNSAMTTRGAMGQSYTTASANVSAYRQTADALAMNFTDEQREELS